MRQYLITAFYCSKCGNALEIPYNKTVCDKAISADKDKLGMRPEPPTGANCRYNNVMYVDPCRKCANELSLPMDLAGKLKEVLEEIVK